MTAQDVADGLGVSKQTVYNWLKSEGLPATNTPKGKLITLRDLIDWHVRRAPREAVKPVKSEAAEPETPAESYEQALARKTRAEADLKELQLASERGDVVAVKDVEQSVGRVAAGLKTAILAMPSKLATSLVGMKTKEQVAGVLKRECESTCRKLTMLGRESMTAPGAPDAD